MTPNPILKVLSTFSKNKVKSLLIGGQACIIYGAAEFSRDSDFVVLVTDKNIDNLKHALSSLKAELIYVPPLEADYLQRGHACHFKCKAKGVRGLRIDIMAKLRGCDPFEDLYKRKKRVNLKEGIQIDILSLEDLVQSKKTQRDKDWFMLKRLVDNDIVLYKDNPSKEKIRWWLFESRSAEALISLTTKYPVVTKECIAARPLLSTAVGSDIEKLKMQFCEEELAERKKDINYWVSLKKELEGLRHRAALKPK